MAINTKELLTSAPAHTAWQASIAAGAAAWLVQSGVLDVIDLGAEPVAIATVTGVLGAILSAAKHWPWLRSKVAASGINKRKTVDLLNEALERIAALETHDV